MNNPTTYALWDLREADLSGLFSNEIREIVLTTKKYAHTRSNGKTAIVASDDLSFGIGRMYENLAEIYEHSIDHQIFRVYDDAVQWLLE